MSEVTKVVSAENAPINNSMNYAKKYAASYEDSGGDSGLPTVSADDNGDVLTVVNGEWDKATPSGGGVLVVNVTEEETGESIVYTMDKTWKEIHDALVSGPVQVVYGDSDEWEVTYVSHIFGYAGDYGVILSNGFTAFPGAGEAYATDSENGYPSYTESL